jgi:hypothetical protein
MTDRATVTASCALCAYRVRVTDDDAPEALGVLRRILLAHRIDDHPESRATSTIRDLLLLREPARG